MDPDAALPVLEMLGLSVSDEACNVSTRARSVSRIFETMQALTMAGAQAPRWLSSDLH
jgi:hypothetical protein